MKKLIRYVLNRVPRRVVQRGVHLVTPILGLAYMGRRVMCPICAHSYREFMPYGYAKSRENALCPCCLALERHRLMWLYLVNETDFFVTKPRLLHIAPERCFIKRFEKSLGNNYITADLESPLAKVKMDIQAIPFGQGEFDVIICNHILEHVEDDRLAMSEMFRVMRPGGWGIMLSPVNYTRETTYEDSTITTPQGRFAAFGQQDHLRDYGCDYSARLTDAGFEVEEIDYMKHLPEGDACRFALRDEIIYFVKKPVAK